LELPDEPVWVLADRTRLTQIVSNLLSNATKFCNAGDQVTVRVCSDAKQGRASVVVRDTGIGIAPEILPYLFETFTQADHTLDRNQGGLGLGLALVKGLVELHGGNVRAASAGPGRGAQLTFWLPLGKKPRATVDAPAPILPAGARQLRILIVED